MKKITKEYEVYTVEELSDSAKENARENFYSDGDIPFLEESMQECLDIHLKANDVKSEDAKVHYSLSYGQGDGAMFTGTIEWKNKYLVTIKHIGNYYHYNSKVFEIVEKETGDNENIQNYSELEKEFDNHYCNISKVLASHGYSYIEDYQSMASFIDTGQANEYTFLADGEMFNA